MPESRSTQARLDEIASLIGRAPRKASRGGTEPREALTDIIRALGLEIDESLPKTRLAAAIARLGGEVWTPECDSEGTPSGGGGTITNVGLDTLIRSVRTLARRLGPERLF